MFRADKNENLKVVSEKEIQERLYGKYCPPVGKGKSLPTVPPSSHKKKKPGEVNLFGQEIAEEPVSALVSKTVLSEPISRPGSKRVKSSVAASRSASQGAEEGKPASKSTQAHLFGRDIMDEGDKPNFRLEWEEWRDRIRRISVWHTLVVVSVLAGVLILFNVILGLVLREDRPLSDKEVGAQMEKAAVQGENMLGPVEPRSAEKEGSPSNLGVSLAPGGEDLAKVEGTPSKEALAESVSVPSPGRAGGAEEAGVVGLERPYYTIQICIYESQAAAKRLVNELRKEGFSDIHYDSITTPSGRKFFRVHHGRYGDFKEAQQNMDSFRRGPIFGRFPDSFIRLVK